jgi:long-subunit acyl-CoA synthetase (AMP-forming)
VSGFIRRKLTRVLGMDRVRIGISGAAPLSTSLIAWYRRLGIEILEGYAMSENFANSHTTRLATLKKLVTDTNASLDKHENLACLIIYAQPWTIESNLITPTLKLKRAQIDSAYEASFERWMSAPDSIVFNMQQS